MAGRRSRSTVSVFVKGGPPENRSPGALVRPGTGATLPAGGRSGLRGGRGPARSEEGIRMPVVQANGIDVYYEVQGEGEPLVLIPYVAADQACYAFQVADYASRFTCYTVDLRGAGLSGKPEGTYTTELFADDVAAFMAAVGIPRADVSGLSLGAAAAMWLAAKHPSLVKSLSLHSAWTATDPYLRAVVQTWQTMAKALDSTTDMV